MGLATADLALSFVEEAVGTLEAPRWPVDAEPEEEYGFFWKSLRLCAPLLLAFPINCEDIWFSKYKDKLGGTPAERWRRVSFGNLRFPITHLDRFKVSS